jgi:hypothetical protein
MRIRLRVFSVAVRRLAGILVCWVWSWIWLMGKWRADGSVAIWWGRWGLIVRERRARERVLLVGVTRRKGYIT